MPTRNQFVAIQIIQFVQKTISCNEVVSYLYTPSMRINKFWGRISTFKANINVGVYAVYVQLHIH